MLLIPLFFKSSIYLDIFSEVISLPSKSKRILYELDFEICLNISIEKESLEILKQISKFNSYNILLDLDGKEITSENISKYIDDLKNKGVSSINFIIGGSNGVNKEVKNSVDMKLKFSYFTFPHQLMRLILLEQIYRWFAISNNIKYHK